MMKKTLLSITIAFLAFNLTAQIPTAGLIGYWTFGGNANDQSGNLYNGVVTGASLTTDRFNAANAAYSFNGTSNFISVADVSPLRLNNTDFTMSTWVNLTSLDTTPTAIISKRTTVSSSGYILNVAGSNTPVPGQIFFNISGGTNPKAASHSAISLNIWNHILILYNLSGQRIRIYLNGILDTDTTGMPSPSGSATSNLFFGKDAAASRYYIHGKLDDIAMYNRALTLTEIQQLYTFSVGINSLSAKSTVEIFPNPVSDYFTVTNLQQAEINIYNPLGKMVKSVFVDNDKLSVDISELAASVYFVQVVDKNRNTFVKKIIKK